jgi:hypothetical protein
MSRYNRHTLSAFLFVTALLVMCVLPPALAKPLPQDGDENEDKTKPSWGPFQVTGGIGVTAQFVDVSGSESKYRTDYNYSTGVNLSEFSLTLTPEGEGLSWLDHFKLDGYGFGDAYPYEQATLVFGKRGLYEFQGRYRKQNYFFDIPNFAMGSHGSDSAQRMTDLSLRLFPHRRATIELAYVRNNTYGTSFTSEWIFQNLVQLINPRRALTQDFRVGATFDLDSLKATVVQNFRKYKDDPSQTENQLVEAGTLPGVDASLPVRLSVPSTQVSAVYQPSYRWSLEGKYRYSKGTAEAGRSESISLQLTEGLTLEQIIRATSVSDRPEHLAEVEASVELTDSLIFSNVFGWRNFEVDGTFFEQQTLGSTVGATIPLERAATSFVEYRTIRNRPELEYVISSEISLFGGYQYEDRLVDWELNQDFTFDEGLREVRIAHSGFGGISWRPYRGSRLYAEFEKGTANNSLYTPEPREFTRIRVNAGFPVGEHLSVNPFLVISDYSNKESVLDYESDQIQAGVDVIYRDPNGRFDLSGGYLVFDLDSLTDSIFYLGGDLSEQVLDYRVSLHFAHVRAMFPIGNRVRLRGAYQLLVDSGNSSYPLDRNIVEAGMNVSLTESWSADIGYVFVSYNEKLENVQDYDANRLGLTLRWGF